MSKYLALIIIISATFERFSQRWGVRGLREEEREGYLKYNKMRTIAELWVFIGYSSCNFSVSLKFFKIKKMGGKYLGYSDNLKRDVTQCRHLSMQGVANANVGTQLGLCVPSPCALEVSEKQPWKLSH